MDVTEFIDNDFVQNHVLTITDPGCFVTRDGEYVVINYREFFHRFRLRLSMDQARVVFKGLQEAVDPEKE